MSETPAHHPVEQLDRQADGARRRRMPWPSASAAAATGAAAPSAPGRERVDQRAVVAGRHVLAGLDRGDHLADAVDDGEHGADQRAVGRGGDRRGQSASASSAAWLSASSRGNSKKPQLPFTVWTKRKMLSSRARSSGCASQATISPPSASSISRHSATKSAIRSSIGASAPSAGFEGPYAGKELTPR